MRPYAPNGTVTRIVSTLAVTLLVSASGSAVWVLAAADVGRRAFVCWGNDADGQVDMIFKDGFQ